MKKKLEDTTGYIRSCNSKDRQCNGQKKKDRQCNGQKKQDKRTNNDMAKYYKEIEQRESHLKKNRTIQWPKEIGETMIYKIIFYQNLFLIKIN